MKTVRLLQRLKIMVNYEIVEVDISDDDQRKLIELFLRQHVSPESISIFDESVTSDSDDLVFCDAVYHTILNEAMIDAIKNKIKEQENETQ